jgi:hypothetical protein
VSLLVAVLVVIRNIFIEVLESSPAVEVVPEVVKVLDLLLGGVGASKGGDGVSLGEASLGLEDLAPRLVVVGLLKLLLGGGLDFSLLINRVKLAALDGVKEDVGGLLDTLEELIVVDTTLGSLLIGVVLENLLAVGLFDLVLSGPPAVLGNTKDLVMILSLEVYALIKVLRYASIITYLPILGLTLKHHGILRLALVANIAIFDILGTLLGLDAIILRESTLVTGSSSVGEEVRADRLDASLSSLRRLANSLEVLIGSPAAGKGGKGECHSSHRSHYVMCDLMVMKRENSRQLFTCNNFFSMALHRLPPL